jgi:hypothetical protein
MKVEDLSFADQVDLTQRVLIGALAHKGRQLFAEYQEIYLDDEPGMLEACKRLRLFAKTENIADLVASEKVAPKPVDIETFLTNDYYLGLEGQVYPKIMEHMIELNSGDYVECVLTGAIGTAKTTIAVWTTAYQLYLLSLLDSPQRTYGLDHSSEIEFIFQSISRELAKSVDYARFRDLIQRSPYFTDKFTFDRDIESELRFPNRIIVKPVSGSDTAAIGQNVIGGVIDEMNFMAVTDNSKVSADGGTYDQAIAVYNSISRRRKSRFMEKGKLPGMLCLVSSKKYPGQFTDTKIEEAERELREDGKTTTYVYDKRTWDILPPETFIGKWFKVFIGDITRKPYILDEGKSYAHLEPHLVVDVPIEYKSEFTIDMMNALRDIAGVSTLASIPFISNLDKLNEAFDPEQESVFTTDECDFEFRQVGIRKDYLFAAKRQFPRFAHVDLGLTSDAAGIVIGHVDKFVQIEKDETSLSMPHVTIDGVLRVCPPPNGEINFEKIRKLFYMLQDRGFPIRWITFDSYQSVDSIQMLRSRGFFTGNQSMDIKTLPYDITKTCILEGRLTCAPNERMQMELARLERTLNGKIDHPPNYTKDVADALAGVVYGLTMQNYIWASFGQSPIGVPTEAVYDLADKSNEKVSYFDNRQIELQ